VTQTQCTHVDCKDPAVHLCYEHLSRLIVATILACLPPDDVLAGQVQVAAGDVDLPPRPPMKP